jgi:exopolysaccharide biosynthesis polyprenyl glycosylphosphotransferase
MTTVDSSPLAQPSRMPLRRLVPPARGHDEVSRASATRTPASTAHPPKHSAGILRPGGIFSYVRAWMVVVPLDGLLLLSPMLWNPDQYRAIVSMTVLATLLLTGCGRYRARLHLSVLDELPSLMTRLLTSAAIVATVIALRHEQAAVVTFLTNAAITIGLVVAGRMLSTGVIAWGRSHQISAHRTVIVGGGPLAAELAKILTEHCRYGLSVVGFVDDGPGRIPETFADRLGRLDDLHRVVATSGADVILVADGDFSERELHDTVRAPACQPCDLLVVPRMHHFATQTGLGDHIGSIPVLRIRRPNLRGLAHTIKRLFDIVVAGSLLIICAPVIAVAALAVRIEGGPGVIFRQTRIGRDGVQFQCLKLRSMRPVNETESDTNWSVAGDKRVQPIGRFLRRTSLDELPQLWNIVRGDMTLVGPRPERPHFVDQFSSQYDRYAHRHRMQAGLTGLAQVSGLRGDTSIADRTRYDNYYIEHWSLWLDIKIVFRTFSEVLFVRGQ